MKRLYLPFLLLLLTILACSNTTNMPTPGIENEPTMPSSTLTPEPTADNTPALDLWYLTRGDVKSDQAWGIDTDSLGNVYVAAYMQQPASRNFYDMVIYKFSPEGKELWQTQWGGVFQEKAFIVTVDEPYLYVGGLVHTQISLIEADMAILSLNMETGEILWDFSWGQGFGYEEVDGLFVDGEDIYVSGWTAGEKTDGDIAVLKLDKNGNLVWVNTWGTDGFDSADGQMVVDENAIYISGRLDADNMFTGGDAVLAKFSKEDGEYLNHTTWGGNAFDDGFGLTSDGDFLYMVGLTISYGNGGQIFLLKYDKDMNLVWDEIWGGPKGESARVVEVDADGNILVAGSTASYGNGEDDVVVLQFSPTGKLNFFQTWGGPLVDAVHGLAIDGNYAYLVGNTASFEIGLSDDLVLKIDRRNGKFPDIEFGRIFIEQ